MKYINRSDISCILLLSVVHSTEVDCLCVMIYCRGRSRDVSPSHFTRSLMFRNSKCGHILP